MKRIFSLILMLVVMLGMGSVCTAEPNLKRLVKLHKWHGEWTSDRNPGSIPSSLEIGMTPAGEIKTLYSREAKSSWGVDKSIQDQPVDPEFGMEDGLTVFSWTDERGGLFKFRLQDDGSLVGDYRLMSRRGLYLTYIKMNPVADRMSVVQDSGQN
jgi:hypothetical protein